LNTLINILGTGRCGSTMLEAMLGNGRGCYSCGEVHALFRPWRRHHFKPSCSCGSPSCSVWKPLIQIKVSEFHQKVFEIKNIDFLIDSSKSLTWLIDQKKWLKDSIRIVNLAIYKEPLDLAYSNWKRGLPIEQSWLHYKRYYSRLFALKFPVITINHHDLIKNPGLKLLSLCNLLNMKYFEGKEKFWEGDLHFLFGSKGVVEQIRRRSSSFRVVKKYPDDFMSSYKKRYKSFLKDEQYLYISHELNRLEINKIKELPNKIISVENKVNLLPLWYYYKRLRQFIGHFYPRQYIIK
jgi:hypothetical protein